MPLDYSKWDALELSDDSDIEVHPNVDKRSFIRAKQAQIHQERQHRRHQITTLKYERIINDGLTARIDRLLTALKSHRDRASSTSADELVLQSLVEASGDPAEDQPPPPPEGVHTHIEEKPTYSKMMAALVDQVKKAVDESKPESPYEAYITEVESHRAKVDGLQGELLQKLAELEKEDKKHITSDDIHDGFDVSHIAKAEAKPATSKTTPELLNPTSIPKPDQGASSGAEADVDEPSRGANGGGSDDEADMSASPQAQQFAKLRPGDYRAFHRFIMDHPALLSERETDGLLVEGFNAQMEGQEAYARQCVHQALLLQYCRQLGRDGVNLFFKRITTPGHQANTLFTDDVASTYARIRERTAALAAQHAASPTAGDPSSAGGVEQIQLHAVDPGTQINIQIPPPVPTTTTASDDANADPQQQQQQEEQQQHRAARATFEAFPPGLRRALESGSLDEVNKVLGKMSVEEAEEVVGQLSESGMLSVEEGVIDATTEEGMRAVREIEEGTGKKGEGQQGAGVSEDPPLD